MEAKESRCFVFATCGASANTWLKRDVARNKSALRLAFSCAGLVTWISAVEAKETEPLSPFARVSGASLGKVAKPAELGALLASLPQPVAAVHVFLLDARSTTSETETTSDTERLQAWRAVAGTLAPLDHGAKVGELVCDVMVAPKGDWAWLGTHRQRANAPRAPGGVQACVTPVEAPSRAYAKVVELLALGELTPRAGWRAVELGAAPGGGTLALLERGIHVTAVDPAPLSDVVLQRASGLSATLHVLHKAAGDIQASELPSRPELLVTDVNLAPSVSLNYLERISKLSRGVTRGVLMTLKINDDAVEAALPALLERAARLGQRLGLGEMRVAHLPSQRREVGVVLRKSTAR